MPTLADGKDWVFIRLDSQPSTDDAPPTEEQVCLFVPYHQMRSAGHPLYLALDRILRDAGFDKYARRCARASIIQ